MAVRLPSARTTFLAAVQEFPRWMSIRKRPDKATTGLFLEAVIEEQTDITEEIKKFIKEFFLISYMGKESTITDYVYIVQVGAIDYATSTLIKPVLDITIDAKTFLDNINVYALYQNGYLIISTSNLPSDGNLLYTYNGYKYGGKLEKYHIWNIFDEFAMFLGLNRFIDTGETNAQLLKRCFLVFSNPANSTFKGLQNTILNCLSNDFDINREEIKIEILDQSNAMLPYNDGTVYEHFVQLNRDIFRTKAWDSTWFEHNFKQLNYMSHVWDKHLNVYQDGTGQMSDLYAHFSADDGVTTRVTVNGYKQDVVTVNEYFRKQNIRKEIPLQLLRYQDMLNPKKVQYKITAIPAVQIDTADITVREQTRVEGINRLFVQDIISNSGYATVINPGLLEKDKQYELVFKARDAYSDMRINKITLVDDSTVTNLAKETKAFKRDGTDLVHVDIKSHASKVSDLKSYDNLIDTPDGFTIGNVSNEATFTLDITGCGNQTLKLSSYGDLFDLTEQTDLWELNGLKFQDHKLVSTTVMVDQQSATLNVSCMGFSIKLLRNVTAQGAVNVQTYVNGVINVGLSRLMTDPDSILEYTFDTISNVKIIFTKSGSYPFEVEVKATKYEITYNTTVGSVIKGPVSNYISDVPDSVPNTLTVTVKSYDVRTPVIRYVHVGPSMSRASYIVKDIKPLTDNAYLDIDSNCKVYLYEIDSNGRVLISDDFNTKCSYVNRTDEDIYVEVDISRFSEILTTSKTIHKTARNGITVSYIILAPNEEIRTLTVTGVYYYEKAIRTLDELLDIDVTYNVYVSEGVSGFIIKNPATDEEWLVQLDRDIFTDDATVFTYEGLPSNISGFFVLDKANNNVLLSNTSNRKFDSTYVTLTGQQQYIAYNEVDMYKASLGETENIEIVSSMFYPVLSNNVMMIYQISTIEDVTGFSATAVFKKSWKGVTNFFDISVACRIELQELLLRLQQGELRDKTEATLRHVQETYGVTLSYSDRLADDITHILTQGSWSLGRKEIFLATNFDFHNSEAFKVTVTSLAPVFYITNSVSLDRYISNGTDTFDLCTFAIKPPEGINVIFETQDDIIENGLMVKEDGFNKLKYSNILEVQTVIVNGIVYSNYTLLDKEGIIVWNNVNNIAGEYFSIAYSYKVPTALVYTNLSYLYDIVGYNVDTLLPVNVRTKMTDEYKDGDKFIVEWEEQPDYVPAPVCSNPNFFAEYKEGTVTVRQLNFDNTVLVNAGYYYDDDKEYYYYNHEFVQLINRYEGIEFHNVKKLDRIFQFMFETVNYVIFSNFKNGNNYEQLCYVKFNDPVIGTSGISALNKVTACDSFNMWHKSNMDVSFALGLKDVGLLFTAEDSNSYAFLNVTALVKPGAVISAFTTEGITLQLYREVKADDDIMVKTIMAVPYSDFTASNDFQGYLVPEDIDLSYRYYLVVKGNGIVDDIIVKDSNLEDQITLHVKPLENFGFTLEEKEVKGTLLSLDFDRDNCNLERLEIAKDGLIQIGTNVDYGITPVFNSKNCYDDFVAAETVVRKKETFVTEDKGGWIKTPFFYLENSASVVDLYVKVNSLISGKTKNFNIKLRTSADESCTVTKELGYSQKTNLAHFAGSQIQPYVQVEIELDSNKVIDTVEVFVRYGETFNIPLIIQDNLTGSLTTKVYDIITVGDYRLSKVIGNFDDKEHIKLFMRGCKQDAYYMVWTNWYEIILNYDLVAQNEPHIFNDYKLFQFKLDFLSDTATALIEQFILEVV